ncbi:MAG TPA: hypothetical protein VI365_14690 [Trebonia sp.]
MQQTVPSTAAVHGQDKARVRRAVIMLAASAGLALSAAGCGGSRANPAASASPSGAGRNVTADGAGSDGSGQRTAGSFSLAFTRCMRAHGVPDFPDPNGQAGQLGPGSGIDPDSPQFQSALNGPCESLAPPGWVGAGKVTR